MFRLSSEDGTNEDNTFDFEQQQQQQKTMTTTKTTNKRIKQIRKTSPQQDGQRDSELFFHLLVSLRVGN